MKIYLLIFTHSRTSDKAVFRIQLGGLEYNAQY